MSETMDIGEALNILDQNRMWYGMKISKRSASAYALVAGWDQRCSVRRGVRESLAGMIVRLAVKVRDASPRPTRAERDDTMAASLGISLGEYKP